MTSQSSFATITATAGSPDFQFAPVNEVALSVQFNAIAGLDAYLGAYWAANRSTFPSVQVLPPLLPVTEVFGNNLARANRVGLRVVTEPIARYWLLRANATELVQVQYDRLIFNWRQVDGTETYPRFPVIRDLFEQEWERFVAFLRAEKLPAPEVNQCEVTYVNHIDYGMDWQDYSWLSGIVAPWSGATSGSFLPAPEGVSIEAHYRLPSNRGRLHISAEPVVRGRDSKEVLQITLTARGAPASGSTSDVLEWMDLGRHWVVNGFVDFTTSRMHKAWGQRS